MKIGLTQLRFLIREEVQHARRSKSLCETGSKGVGIGLHVPLSSDELRDMLADLHHNGATIVLVTHELGALADLVSRVVVLGKRVGATVLYDGPPPPPATLHDPYGHHSEPPRESGWSGA